METEDEPINAHLGHQQGGLNMKNFSPIPLLGLIIAFIMCGCDAQAKKIAQERDDLKKNAQVLSSQLAQLSKDYDAANKERMDLREKLEKLSTEKTAGKCSIEGAPQWEFKDRDYLAVCRGTVKNTGTVSVSNITVMIIVRDENHEAITIRYTNDGPPEKSIFYAFVRDRMIENDTAEFTVSFFNKFMHGDDLKKVKDSIAAGGDRVEIKPMFIQ
jgi:outer membrane murein-binding lipoprotein Lpp